MSDVAQPLPRGRPTKFTPERIEQIRTLVERGVMALAIADIVGCTIGTLKVTCSRLGISLRRPNNSRFMMKPTMNGDNVVKLEMKSRSKDSWGEFAIIMTYRGQQRVTPIQMNEDTLFRLVMRAELEGLRLGELIAKIIVEGLDDAPKTRALRH